MKMIMSYSGREHSNNDVFSHHSSPGDGEDQRRIGVQDLPERPQRVEQRNFFQLAASTSQLKNDMFYRILYMYPQIC